MTHSTRIPVTAELEQAFGSARLEKNLRILKVEIEDETLVLRTTRPAGASVSSDWNGMSSLFEAKKPCFVLFRLDSSSSDGAEWVLVSYVPDGSPVRDRMVYASTRDTLKRQLGYNSFSDEMHGSSADELTWDLFQQHDKKNFSNAPLTEAEVQTAAESRAEVDYGHTREYVHSVAFPISDEASSALRSLATRVVDLVILRVDAKKETLELRSSSKASASDIAQHIPSDEPAFILFRYTHDYKGEQQAPIFFIYSCPDGATVRNRMLYSTVKATACEAAAHLGVEITKKIEVSEPSEVTENSLSEEIHPPEVEQNKGFQRPSRPGRGRARVTRN
eukprot:TRINITY_DN9786_c0_g1_i1.p1 TRINITY_DN9786_c0_g1~~TRINITY_DN9786_c0_g1_i1.p1  ORF type:complete len:343 (-),score=156.66 TRINITY_DN9786_c0_g1_i1:72-1073(-)